MSTKKKPPPHTVAARTEKTAATRATKRDDSDSLRALWYAAAAAWHAADPSEQGCEDWDDMSPAAEAARFYFWRARLGVEAVDKMRTAIRDEDHAGSGEYFKKPPGFKGWSKLAASLFDELGVSVDVDLAVGDKREWSVYHLEIIRDAKDPLYCPRGERPPPREFVKSIGEYDGVYDPIKVVRRKPRGIPIVSDGRQRTNGVRVHNAQELVRYYAKLEQTLRYHEPQRSIIEKPNTVDDIELPKLIRAVPILVHDVKRGRILKAISNANRVSESVLDEARAVWDLHDEFKEQGKSEWIVGKIARLRSSSDQVVYNYLKLRKLTHKWQEKLAAGTVRGWLREACSAPRSPVVVAHLQELLALRPVEGAQDGWQAVERELVARTQAPQGVPPRGLGPARSTPAKAPRPPRGGVRGAPQGALPTSVDPPTSAPRPPQGSPEGASGSDPRSPVKDQIKDQDQDQDQDPEPDQDQGAPAGLSASDRLNFAPQAGRILEALAACPHPAGKKPLRNTDANREFLEELLCDGELAEEVLYTSARYLQILAERIPVPQRGGGTRVEDPTWYDRRVWRARGRWPVIKSIVEAVDHAAATRQAAEQEAALSVAAEGRERDRIAEFQERLVAETSAIGAALAGGDPFGALATALADANTPFARSIVRHLKNPEPQETQS